MHLLYYSFIIISSSCQQQRNASNVINTFFFKSKDELTFLCSNLYFSGLIEGFKYCWCSLFEHYAPFFTSNWTMLHVLRAIRSEHMPHCVLQGGRGLSLQ